MQPRSQRQTRQKKKQNRRMFRWVIRLLSLGAVFLCLFSAWHWFGSSVFNQHIKEPSSLGAEDTGVPKDRALKDEGVVIEDSSVEIEAGPGGNLLEDVRLAFVGDIMMGGNVERLLQREGYHYPYVHVASILKEADIAAGNLESPITSRGEAVDKSYVFRTSPDAVPELAKSGLTVFNLANNHTLDYGLIGLQDTIHELTQAGLHSVGAGMNEEEAYRSVIIEKNGIRIAFLGFSRVIPHVSWKADRINPGLAETYDYTRPVRAVEAAKEQADIVVVMVHWGVERSEIPEPYQSELAYRYIDAGADLIIGSHPHVLQGLEQYRGKWIAYSLGNFIFTTSGNPRTNEAVILQANCTKAGDCQLKAVPLFSGSAQPKPMEEPAAKLLLERFSQISFGVEISENGHVRTFLSPLDVD